MLGLPLAPLRQTGCRGSSVCWQTPRGQLCVSPPGGEKTQCTPNTAPIICSPQTPQVVSRPGVPFGLTFPHKAGQQWGGGWLAGAKCAMLTGGERLGVRRWGRLRPPGASPCSGFALVRGLAGSTVLGLVGAPQRGLPGPSSPPSWVMAAGWCLRLGAEVSPDWSAF